MDYVAVDLTRVVLQPMVGGTDYINCSWVPGYSRSDQYILSQVWVFLSQDYLLTSLLSTLAPPLLASSGTWSTRCLQYNQLRLLIKDLSDGDKYFKKYLSDGDKCPKKYFSDGDQPDRVPVRVPTAVLAGGVQAASSTWETFSGARCGDLSLRISSGLP